MWSHSKVKSKVAQSYPTLCDHVDCSLPGSSVHGILQARILGCHFLTLWQIDGKTVETMADFIFWAPKSLQMVTAAMKLKDAYSLEEKL